ncbi:MAG: hypothetical protein ACLPTF_16640 [Steroidobacteraceae bacterium]
MSRRRDSKPTHEGQRAVNVNEFIRAGYLRAIGSSWTVTWFDWANRPAIALDFTYRGDRLEVANSSGGVQAVKVVHKRCGPDSWRQHFKCPIPECPACVDVLFVANFRDYEHGLGCRHCLDLVYGRKAHRALHRMRTIRERHGMEPDPLRPAERPKGMHWQTYWRLRGKLNNLQLRWARAEPLMAPSQAQLFDDLQALPTALDAMIAALRSLPQQTTESAETTWAALEAFDTRYHRLMSESQRTRLYAALPPPPPDPPRVEGGTGMQRRYRPPRPASRRRKQRAEAPP